MGFVDPWILKSLIYWFRLAILQGVQGKTNFQLENVFLVAVAGIKKGLF
jgi:hypothetical protein